MAKKKKATGAVPASFSPASFRRGEEASMAQVPAAQAAESATLQNVPTKSEISSYVKGVDNVLDDKAFGDFKL